MNLVYDLLIKPFSYAFMQRATLALIILGVVAGVIGCFIVIRGMAFLTDALAHAILPGVAIAYLIGGLGGPLALGAFGVGAISALIIGWLTKDGKLKEDTAIGIVFTFMLALGIALISIRNDPTGLTHILVGNVLTVSNNDIWLIASVGMIVLGLTVAFYKELVLNSFDPDLARALHLPSDRLRYLLLFMLTGTIVIALQAIGVTLISSLLITPAATAYLLTKRLPTMMALSATLAALGGVVGLLLAWHLSIAPSSAIVITLSLCFLLAFLFSPRQGLLRAKAKLIEVEE